MPGRSTQISRCPCGRPLKNEPLVLPVVAIKFDQFQARVSRQPLHGRGPFTHREAGATKSPIVEVNERAFFEQRGHECQHLISRILVKMRNVLRIHLEGSSRRPAPMKRPRIVFVSRGKWGPSLLRWVKGLSCDVVFADTENRRIDQFPDYDLGISFLYGHRIPASEFEKKRTWINFHSAPLPELRGVGMAYHAIMLGAPEFGASVHYMNAGLDTGELIEVQRFAIKPYHTAGDLVRRSHRLLIRLFRKHIPAILRGTVPSTPQGPGRYYSRETLPVFVELTEEQGRLIRALTVHPLHHAHLRIGGRSYRIIPDDFADGGYP